MAEVARQLFVTYPPLSFGYHQRHGSQVLKSLFRGRTLIEKVAGRKTKGESAPCSNAGKAHITKSGDLVWYD